MCVAVSLFAHVTVDPTFTVKVAGSKGHPSPRIAAPGTIRVSALKPELFTSDVTAPLASMPTDAPHYEAHDHQREEGSKPGSFAPAWASHTFARPA